jgi:hypothetical protein
MGIQVCLSVYLSVCLSIYLSMYPYIYLSIYLSIYLWLYSPLLDLGRFFSFLILYTIGRTLWTGDQPVARLLPTHRTTQRQKKPIQTSMPRVGFEPTIPELERAKTVHALHRAVAVIGGYKHVGFVNCILFVSGILLFRKLKVTGTISN